MTDATDTHTYERLYRETIPSVVSVYVTPEADGERGRHGAGSGFVYDRTHVVTNEHVVGDATEVDLRFSERDWRRGRVVGTDAYTDLAVVAVEDLPGYATPLELVAENPVPGTPVAALGNPMGLDGSISSGIVSGASRSMPTGNGFAIPDTVQTDAPINPGNSGGPLVTSAGLRTPGEASGHDDGEGNGGDESDSDARARVVGVNRARAGDNIGFAVSADVVRRVVPELIETGEVRHSYLRIRTLDVSPTVAEANDLAETRGVLVVDVSLGPASGALVGCERTSVVRGREVPTGGDVIVAIDGDPVDSHEALMRHLLLETAPGEEVTVDLLRGGERLTEHVTLAERPAPEGRPRRGRGRRGGRGGGHIPVR